MGVLIDSTVLVYMERRVAEVSSHFRGREDEEAYVSVISASELLHGVHRARTDQVRARRAAFVEALLAAFPILDIDLPTARLHARLWADLEPRGIMIGVHDSWLAATCLAHGLKLITDNTRHFQRVAGLQVEVWPWHS